MKLVSGTLICLALLLCLSSCSTPSKSKPDHAAAIKTIYEQDRALFTNTFRTKVPLRGKQYANAIQGYAARLRSMDFSGTPKQFEIAYLKHIQAWEAVAFEVQNKPEKDILPLIAGLGLAVATGGVTPLAIGAAETAKPNPAAQAAQTAMLNAKRGVEQTWNEIEIIALQSGVRFK